MLRRQWFIIQATAFITIRRMLTNIITLQLCIVAAMVCTGAIIPVVTIIEATVTAMVIADNTLQPILS